MPRNGSLNSTTTKKQQPDARSAPKYRLYLEASADVTLTELDHFPRDLWLDCCGHLSLFTVRNRTYGSSPDEEFGDKSMQIRLRKVL